MSCCNTWLTVLLLTAIGCSDLTVPSNAWMKKVGDNVMIKCNDTMETWYFTCQRNQWIGDWGNCTHSRCTKTHIMYISLTIIRYYYEGHLRKKHKLGLMFPRKQNI